MAVGSRSTWLEVDGGGGCGRAFVSARRRTDAVVVETHEVLQRLGSRATASHETAARLWGVELVERGLDRVTAPRQRGRALAPGWVVRRHDLTGDEVVVLDGLRRTTPLRTALDLAQVLPFDEAVAAADSALRHRLVDRGELVATLSARRGRAAAGPRRVAGAVDPCARSVLESLLRVLLLLGGLPAPLSQYVVRDRCGAFVARVDLCWPSVRLVVEADGFAFHSDRASYRADRQRLNALERLGWRVLRFTWEDVRGHPEQVCTAVLDCLTRAA